MLPVSSDKALDNLEKLSTDKIRPGIISVGLLPSITKPINYSPLRCGSTGGITSDDDVDNEIINVTDDDDVVITTTDSTAPSDMLKVR